VESYTAKCVKLNKGYMGQIVEWPEVVTEGKDIEECRPMLKDALIWLATNCIITLYIFSPGGYRESFSRRHEIQNE
jgi:hypothetical protein